MKRCTKCNLEKPETEFHRRGKSGLHAECKTCRCAREREGGKRRYYADLDRSRETNREKRRKERQTMETWCAQIISPIRRRAAEQNLPFDLDAGYLRSIWPANNLCPVLYTEFLFGREKGNNAGPSVDRRVPEKGYVRGNVTILSYRANRLKCDATPSELLAVIDYVKQCGL
jgi:hypothetical protein